MYEIKITSPNYFFSVDGKIIRSPFKKIVSKEQLVIIIEKIKSFGSCKYELKDLGDENENVLISRSSISPSVKLKIPDAKSISFVGESHSSIIKKIENKKNMPEKIVEDIKIDSLTKKYKETFLSIKHLMR